MEPKVWFDDRAELEVPASETRALCDAPRKPAVKVKDTVWAQWTPNAWYRGKIEKPCATGFHVAFDDGDQACLSPALIVQDVAPKDGPATGTRVLARWHGGRLYPGTVAGRSGESLKIAFDDGDSGLAARADVRSFER